MYFLRDLPEKMPYRRDQCRQEREKMADRQAALYFLRLLRGILSQKMPGYGKRVFPAINPAQKRGV
jgi:hypothetical protein